MVLFDARPRLGGLNEYGLATYKTAGGFAQQEIEWLLSIGGIEPRANQQLGRDFTLESLLADFDAVFLGMGLAGVNALGIDAPRVEGLRDAVDFIAELRQSDPAQVPIGRRVLVIGGGMTAVDAAVQSRLLGAEQVTIVYRRSAEAMPASGYERHWAQTHGVTIREWAAPKDALTKDGALQGMRFAATALQDGKLVETGESFTLEADMVLRAIGQTYVPGPAVEMTNGRIATGEAGRTSLARVWAGGDCRHGGRDLTVEAVEHGKRSAVDIDLALRGAAAAVTAMSADKEIHHG